MNATIHRTRRGACEVVTFLHGAGCWCWHGTFPTFTEACESAARQGFSITNAVFDGAMGGWTTTDIALYPFDREGS